MRYFVVPARKGSKRLPKKNRKLLDYTLDSIPFEKRVQVVLTSDDSEILKKTKEEYPKVKRLTRPSELARDETPIRPVLKHVAESLNLKTDDELVLLYLTYPQRTYEDIKKAINLFERRREKSLLCKQPPKTHPYLCMKDEGQNKGSQLIDHDLHRYQDYPDVFEISHYIAIQKVGELDNLKKNLFNEDTVFFPIENVIDVDEEKDLKKFFKNNKDSDARF